MTAPLVFLDTETTGLNPDLHEIWEVGLYLRRDGKDLSKHHWFVQVDLKNAEPKALEIGRFHRYDPAQAIHPRELVDLLWRIIPHKAHLVGAVISFDEERLRRLFRTYTPTSPVTVPWHYHLVDVEAMAAGYLGIEPPWDSEQLANALGVPIVPELRHTALGDARWAMDIYDAIQGRVVARGAARV